MWVIGLLRAIACIQPGIVCDTLNESLRPGGRFVNSFSNRCFPSKVINGWASNDDRGHVAIVAEYYRRSGPWQNLEAALRNPEHRGDPLYAVWADR